MIYEFCENCRLKNECSTHYNKKTGIAVLLCDRCHTKIHPAFADPIENERSSYKNVFGKHYNTPTTTL